MQFSKLTFACVAGGYELPSLSSIGRVQGAQGLCGSCGMPDAAASVLAAVAAAEGVQRLLLQQLPRLLLNQLLHQLRLPLCTLVRLQCIAGVVEVATLGIRALTDAA